MDKMSEDLIHYTFQSHAKSIYFNLEIENPYTGNFEYYHGTSIEQIDNYFIEAWLNLETCKADAKPNKIKEVEKKVQAVKALSLPSFPVNELPDLPTFPQM